MTSPILFMSTERVLALTGAAGDIETGQVEPFILEAQYSKLRPVLGDDLYDSIVADLVAEGTTYAELLESTANKPDIAQTLAWWTLHGMLPSVWGRITQNGLLTATNSFGNSVTFDEMSIYRGVVSARAQEWQQALQLRLRNEYPQFTTKLAGEIDNFFGLHPYQASIIDPTRNDHDPNRIDLNLKY